MTVLRRLGAVARGSAALFFVPGVPGGAGLWLLLAAASPPLAGAAALALVAAYGMAAALGLRQAFWDYPAHIYNPLLVGLSIGALFHLTPAILLFTALAGAASALVTAGLGHLLWSWFRLPALTLPFVIVASGFTLASRFFPSLAPAAAPGLPGWLAAEPAWPLAIAGYLRSLGAVLFLPAVPVGLIVALALLLRSRILFLLSALGYAAGALTRGALLGSLDAACAQGDGFNALFAAMAVGGIFLTPSPAAYGLAAVAAALTAVAQDALAVAFAPLALPVFILPFNLVTLAFAYALIQFRHPQRVWLPGRTPEETLANHLTNRRRYGDGEPLLSLPFAGRWTVWQGFDGRWTHQGKGRYAYDFVVADESGRTHTGDGRRLHDYFAFRKPVLSPVRGRVARVENGRPDSPPGVTDEAHRGGNLVILEDPRGFFVELSHFAADSIRVKPGDTVERGETLGLCGNSGYSPQPHIHVQVQSADDIAAETRPFRFASYAEGNVYRAQGRPEETREVEPLYPDKRLDQLTGFVLDERVVYDVRRGGRRVGELSLTVRMAPDGTLYFESRKGRLYFGKYEGTFYFYRVEGSDPWLRRWSLALPSLPLAGRAGLTWDDFVPAGLLASRAGDAALGMLNSFFPSRATAPVRLRFAGDYRVEAEASPGLFHAGLKAGVTFDARKGFAEFAVNDWRFVRRDEAATAPSPAAS